MPERSAVSGGERGGPLRFAIFGAGFWSRFQLAAWREVGGVECVAVYNRSRARAEQLAAAFGIPAVYDDPEALFDIEKVDFADVISSPDTHATFVELAAAKGVPVICQKPMTPSLPDSERLVRLCRESQVPFFVHENFRWQRPVRQVAAVLREGTIGRPFRAHLDFSSGFPVFANQPFLATLDRFILADVGVHLLDMIRFLFGEVETVYCIADRVNPNIAGEDVATIVLQMRAAMSVIVTISYATHPEVEPFPETLVRIEGDRGSIVLAKDSDLRITSGGRTVTRQVSIPHYPWADPAYDLVHASIVDCNANLLAGLKGTGAAETTADDNIRTLRLVEASYASAGSGAVVDVSN